MILWVMLFNNCDLVLRGGVAEREKFRGRFANGRSPCLLFACSLFATESSMLIQSMLMSSVSRKTLQFVKGSVQKFVFGDITAIGSATTGYVHAIRSIHANRRSNSIHCVIWGYDAVQCVMGWFGVNKLLLNGVLVNVMGRDANKWECWKYDFQKECWNPDISAMFISGFNEQ